MDIYGPQLYDNPIQFIQLNDYIYCLTKMTTTGCSFKSTTLRDNNNVDDLVDSSYYWKITENSIKTYIYQNDLSTKTADIF
jgi:hypothetical protein